ncbi:MAG: hypothetical protein FD129_3435, partial [bacterium]
MLTKIKLDDDNDGVAEVTLSAADVVSSVVNGVTIDMQLSAGAAAAIEALNTSTIELMLDSGAVTDPLNNPNLLVTHLDNKP